MNSPEKFFPTAKPQMLYRENRNGNPTGLGRLISTKDEEGNHTLFLATVKGGMVVFDDQDPSSQLQTWLDVEGIKLVEKEEPATKMKNLF